MKIIDAKLTFSNENLISPFGFKGSYVDYLTIVKCKITTDKTNGVGYGLQSILWSDAGVFSNLGNDKGNELMLKITNYALNEIKNVSGDNPISTIDKVYNKVLNYAKSLYANLRETFVKNALVAVDNALWQAYGKENNVTDITKIIPTKYLKALNNKHKTLCNVPLITYGVSESDIKMLLDGGSVLLKIKIGNDLGGKLSKAEMLENDKKRINVIHNIAKNYKSKYSKSGNILYYLDANGQYDTINRVNELINYLKEIGAYDNVVLFEEPFDEFNEINVSSLPIRVVADESVHSENDVLKRINLGYKAIALKPIAKTLSETLKILKIANDNNIICFCADLTVPPIMVEWNKQVASRIDTLPELNVGIMESNGKQNYVNWKELTKLSPLYNKLNLGEVNGVYTLTDEYFDLSGGIFM